VGWVLRGAEFQAPPGFPEWCPALGCVLGEEAHPKETLEVLRVVGGSPIEAPLPPVMPSSVQGARKQMHTHVCPQENPWPQGCQEQQGLNSPSQ
jgi:hypothetical protein